MFCNRLHLWSDLAKVLHQMLFGHNPPHLSWLGICTKVQHWLVASQPRAGLKQCKISYQDSHTHCPILRRTITYTCCKRLIIARRLQNFTLHTHKLQEGIKEFQRNEWWRWWCRVRSSSTTLATSPTLSPIAFLLHWQELNLCFCIEWR